MAPRKLITVSAYARLRGLNRKEMARQLARVGWKGPVEVRKVDKLLKDAKDIRFATDKAGKASVSMAEACRRERMAKAIQQELKLQKIQGTLVEKSAVEKKLYELQRRNRDAMANIPARLSGILAAESNQDVVFRLLTEEIQQAMTRLSE